MATSTNPLFDDLGIDQNPPAKADNPLMADIGIERNTEVTDAASSASDSLLKGNERVAGLGARALGEGLANTVDLAAKVGHAVQDIPQWASWEMLKHMRHAFGMAPLPDSPLIHSPVSEFTDTPSGQDVADQVANKFGLPTPQTPTERVGSAALRAVPSVLLGEPEAAIPSLLPTAASGAASQIAAEKGVGPVGQIAAGLLPIAGTAGIAAGVKGLVRGGSEGAAQMQQNLDTAQNAGINLSAGQASGSGLLKTVESVGAHVPGGGPLAETRGAGLNQQAEESVANITKKLAPNHVLNPPTPMAAGEAVEDSVKKTIRGLKNQTNEVSDAMFEAGGGKETPVSAPKLASVLPSVTAETGMPEVDKLITGAKTKTLAKTAQSVENTSKPSTASYSTDGEGAHMTTSPNGETHAVEQANGDFKITRSDTAEGARGNGEGTDRLETLAHAATGQGKNLVSDISVSPAEAAAYEKLGRRGWSVTKNPNAEVNPETGNIISDSPKNPVYSVRAPKTEGGPMGPTAPKTPSFGDQRMDWTYNPKTGQSEPAVGAAPPAENTPSGITASLNATTPWTLDGLKQFRTDIGKSIKRTKDPVQQRQLAQLYGAATDDLRGHMSAQGPQAEQAWDLFNHVAGQNAATQKTLVRAVKEAGGPEATFKAAMSGSKDGLSKVAPVMNSLDDEGKNLFRATVLHRLGRAGGAADAPFNANTYLNNYRNLAPEAKDMLFGSGSASGPPTQLRKSLDSLSSTMQLLEKQGYIKSGFVKGVEQGTSGLHKLGVFGALAVLAEGGGKTIMHAAQGHPLLAAGAATGAAGVLTGNPIMSRVLTNPKTVGWLAQATKAPKAMVPVLLNQLNQMGTKDPDAKDLHDLIQQSGGQAVAKQGKKDTGVVPKEGTIYPQINRSAGMQPLPGGGFGIPPETM
jgi:hypothetical protein